MQASFLNGKRIDGEQFVKGQEKYTKHRGSFRSQGPNPNLKFFLGCPFFCGFHFLLVTGLQAVWTWAISINLQEIVKGIFLWVALC
jgi:hypothetical protein